MSYQAVPPDSSLLKNTAQDESKAALTSARETEEVAENDSGSANSPGFVPHTAKLRRNDTDSDNDEFYFGRRWDMLHYLLSDIRRDPQQSYYESDLIYRAIHGGEQLGDMVLPQGVPVRYLTPPEVKEISKILGRIEAAALEEFWDPPRMRELGVYKIRGDGGDAMELVYLKEEFEKLKDFYLRAAIYDEAVLVYCD